MTDAELRADIAASAAERIQPQPQPETWWGKAWHALSARELADTHPYLARQGFDAFDRISFWRTPTAQCKTQNNQCVPYHKWVSDYIAMLGGR